jgi:PDZ domain-containing protein
MSRRTVAGLLALGLMVALGVVAARTPVDYVTFRPGPTMNVLGKYAGKTIVTVSGHEEYRDDGALRMVTVYPSGPDDNISLLNMVYGWVDPDIAVLPKDAVYVANTDPAGGRPTTAIPAEIRAVLEPLITDARE